MNGDGHAEEEMYLDLFEDAKEDARYGRDRLVMSVIDVMGLTEGARFMNVEVSTMRAWVSNGVPRERRADFVRKRPELMKWRPAAIPPDDVDEVAGRSSGDWLDDD